MEMSNKFAPSKHEEEGRKKEEGVKSIIFIKQNCNILLLSSSCRMPVHSSGKGRLTSYSRYLKHMISYRRIST
jgi:hypothetical protein